MEHTWRWFGPGDPITLEDIRQTGATGVVTALHDFPAGQAWPVLAVRERRDMIEAAGLRWAVVESIPVHEAIKQGRDEGDARPRCLAAWCETLDNLAACGIRTVCYNFMPVLDWTRTELAAPVASGGRALRFDHTAFAAFELFVLQRPDATADYSAKDIAAARAYAQVLDGAGRERLMETVIAGLPGTMEHYTPEGFLEALSPYRTIDETLLREHLTHFLQTVVPVAERLGMRLAIHPDDPPRALLGLPRIVSTLADLQAVIQAVPSPANGITFCTGSLGVRADNELVTMARMLASQIHFAHLRATRRDKDDPRSFEEAPHLEGDVDMVGVIGELLLEEERRHSENRSDLIPMRPDHGHQLLDDLIRVNRSGYPLIGRLRGLAELRGVECALTWLK